MTVREKKQENIDAARLFNSPEDTITDAAAQEFIECIKQELEDGYGFVPFVGAGLSAPSGAPLVWELRGYLHRCICLALGSRYPGKRPWNPRTDQWPPFSDHQNHNEEEWLQRIRNSLNSRRREDPWHPEAAVFQEALGAMAEWRTSLLFLSRIVCERRGVGHLERYVVVLDAPNQDVIDSCIRHAMTGKQPTLGHRMLATLATLLRLNVILTTNFDDLLERAFFQARNPLTVFDVHLNSNLPPLSAVSEQRSLIKMHGNLYSLRVDYTLDTLPTEADRWRFLHYLEARYAAAPAAPYQDEDNATRQPTQSRNHLLIMGMSAKERRTRAFIEHAWKHLDEHFKVYWICYNVNDVLAVREFTKEFHLKNKAVPLPYERSRILRYSHLGLLLMQLYQTIRYSVPTSGLIFPSAARLAMPPLPDGQALNESIAASKQKYVNEVDNRLKRMQTTGFSKHTLLVVTSVPSVPGTTSVCAEVFQRVQERDQIAIWLDMNDISSTEDLFEQLWDAACYRVGTEHWMPVYVDKFAKNRAAEIRRVASSTNAHWVIFLNARETPGTNLTDNAESLKLNKYPNNWLDSDPDCDLWETNKATDDESNSLNHFLEFVSELCAPSSSSISVILLCRQSATQSSRLIEEVALPHRLIDEPTLISAPCISFNEDAAIARSFEWTMHATATIRKRRQRFLQALLTLQRTRYLASMWDESALIGDNREHPDERLEWLIELATHGLVRRKPGGFVWMRAQTRTRMRDILRDPAIREDFIARHLNLTDCFNDWDPTLWMPEIHWKLALWHHRVLMASGAPAAVFEAVYHACRSAETQLRNHQCDRDLRYAIECITWAASLLHSQAFLIQTQGYSRGSCRRLTQIRHRHCDDIDFAIADLRRGSVKRQSAFLLTQAKASTLHLRIRCTEVMRAIAREVGEDRRAYARQKEVRELLSGGATRSDNVTSTKWLKHITKERNASPSDALLEWVRWWRWNGMLGIASRSYDAAASALVRAIIAIGSSASKGAPASGRLPFTVAMSDISSDSRFTAHITWILETSVSGKATVLGRKVTDQQQVRLEVVRILEQLVALELLQSSLARRDKFDSWNPTKTRCVVAHIETAMEFVRLIIAHDHSAESRMNSPVLWCQSRLMLHRGVCALRLSEWKDAMIYLAHAEAALDLCDARRRAVDRAVIELHRAEVKLWEANSQEIVLLINDRSTPTSFAMISHIIERPLRVTPLWRHGASELREKYRRLLNPPSGSGAQPSLKHGLRASYALVQDAISFLNRAEALLAARRRNVWWTTWYFQRRLKTIAMSVWATIFHEAIIQEKTAIPFFGYESAPCGSPSLADKVLDDALRMIRVDAYRLATIVEAYAECLDAFYTHLYITEKGNDYADRLESMRMKMLFAVERLVSVSEEREPGSQQVIRESDDLRRDKLMKDRTTSDMFANALRYIARVVSNAKALSIFVANNPLK